VSAANRVHVFSLRKVHSGSNNIFEAVSSHQKGFLDNLESDFRLTVSIAFMLQHTIDSCG
jgi:hypothetical protein